MTQREKRVAGILLAAGTSTRMGKTKQLLPFGEKTLIERVLVEALNS
ncbi:MAG: NTP transferase domain-containing protein, partial [Deltaproteobacteria bacterium]|nr:NTP transferase domain-containing protein [Deltaproteobacteria bacterium]